MRFPEPGVQMLDLNAIATAADLQPDDARTKGLEQHLGIGRVIAQVGDDQRVALVTAVDARQRAGARAAVEAKRQLIELSDPGDAMLKWAPTAHHRSRLRPTS